ncbi:hypothetical protein ScPMuIL_008907 [Solemya velum]
MGCLLAGIKDITRSDSSPFLNSHAPGITIQSQELYQLAQYLQEALHREKMLEQKLSTLQQLVHNTQEASESGWQALIDEDRLLSRLEVLENQLHTYSKNHSEDTLRQELVALQEDKLNYETTAKESLRQVLQEKLEAVRKLSELEQSLTNSEDECSHLKKMCEMAQDELQQLAEKYQDQLKEVQDLQIKLHEAEREHEDEVDKIQKEKHELLEKLEEMEQRETSLNAKYESLQADNDITKEQLAAIKAKLESSKEPNENKEKLIDEDDNKSIDSESSQNNGTEIIPLSQKDIGPENLEGKLKDTQQQIEDYKNKLEESDRKMKESSEKVELLQNGLELAKLDSLQSLAKIATLEEKLKMSDLHINTMTESAVTDLKLQLKESRKQADSSNDVISSLRDQVSELEAELALYKIPQPERSADMTLVKSSPGQENPDTTLTNHIESQALISESELDLEDSSLQELLRGARELQYKAELELKRHKVELEENKVYIRRANEEVSSLRLQLQESQQQDKDKSDTVVQLKEQLIKAESTTKEVKQQIIDLRDKLLEEQEHTHLKDEEAQSLKCELDQERNNHRNSIQEVDKYKRQLQEAQQSSKQNHNEAEQLRNKLKHTLEESEFHRKDRQRDPHHVKLSHIPVDTHRPSPRHRAEFMALKDECAGLKKRIQAIEAEMKMSRKENLQLSSEYNKLQESYKELEALKEKLESKEMAWRLNLTDAQKETEQSKQETQRLNEDISQVSGQCKDYSDKVDELCGELKNMTEEYRQLADRSKVLSFCCSIPLLMLLFAILIAFYPTLEKLTATTT